MNKITLISLGIIVLVLVLLGAVLIGEEDEITGNYVVIEEEAESHTAEFDAEILDVLKEKSEVGIIVRLPDESGIIVEGTKEEKREQLSQIDEWFKPRIEEIVSDYSDDEDISIIRSNLRGFGAKVNEEGFWKLVHDPRVSLINYGDATVYGSNNNTFTIAGKKFIQYGNVLVESSIINSLSSGNNTKVRVMIVVNESFSDDYDKIKSEIISSLSEEEFELGRTLPGEKWISGYLTFDGVEKLKDNNYIEFIHEELGGTTSGGEEIKETITIAGREFVQYGNILVESSVIQDYANGKNPIELGIWIDSENTTLIKDLKEKVIQELGKEFNLTYDGGGKGFAGYLTMNGLNELRNLNYQTEDMKYPIIVHEITIGTTSDF